MARELLRLRLLAVALCLLAAWPAGGEPAGGGSSSSVPSAASAAEPAEPVSISVGGGMLPSARRRASGVPSDPSAVHPCLGQHDSYPGGWVQKGQPWPASSVWVPGEYDHDPVHGLRPRPWPHSVPPRPRWRIFDTESACDPDDLLRGSPDLPAGSILIVGDSADRMMMEDVSRFLGAELGSVPSDEWAVPLPTELGDYPM